MGALTLTRPEHPDYLSLHSLHRHVLAPPGLPGGFDWKCVPAT